MTTKEIAEAVGKGSSTVAKWVDKASLKMRQISLKMRDAAETKKPADYTLEETLAIIETGMGRNAADLFAASAKTKQTDNTAIIQSILPIMYEMMKEMFKQEQQQIQPQRPIYLPKPPPLALVPVPPLDYRMAITKIINNWAATNLANDFHKARSDLYTEYGYRTGSNPRKCATNRNKSVIEYLDSEGKLPLLYSLAVEIYGFE